MKIVYQGVDYRQVTAQRGAAPLHIIEMQAQSKRADLRELLPDGALSLGVLLRWSREAQAYGAAVARWERDVKAGAATADDEPSPPDCAVWLSVVNLFLTLRSGGWRGTLRDAAEIPQGDVRYVREVGDLDEHDAGADDEQEGNEAPDPTRPAAPDGPATSGSDASLDGSPVASEPGLTARGT
jgi:hypothetical protein